MSKDFKISQNNDLTQGSVSANLVRLTVPMVFGMFSMVMFNLVDTFFVSRLGTQELAAMGFTFPVVMFVASISLGLGVATSSVVSRAIGRGNQHQVQRLTTDSLILSVIIVIIFTAIGFFTMEPMFKLLGATAEIIPLIKQYMSIWYLGAIFVVVPMVGNYAIRASGDAFYPSLIMITSTLINIILDPLLIFGLAGFPRLELAGAALATVISRAVSLTLALLILHYRQRLLSFSRIRLKEMLESWQKIIYIAIPTSASRILLPFAMALIMRLVAGFGKAAVAAVGTALRIEMFVFMVIMALATALIPFAGQNWGARRFERVKQASLMANRFALLWGGLNFILLLGLAVPLGNFFSRDLAVSRSIAVYFWITPLGYGLRSISLLTASLFNAINRPLIASALSILRMFLLYLPLAYLGSLWLGLEGLFLGLSIANIFSGLVALYYSQKLFAN